MIDFARLDKEEVLELVDYVYGQDHIGEPEQEVGGVEVTLAGLCTALNIDKEKAANTELDRVWRNIEKIRRKEQSKPDAGPLPGTYDGN